MKLPLSWMRDFVSVDAPVEEISRRLSFAGLVVENVEKLTPGFAGVFAARVVNVEKHPNADRLNLVEVDAGTKGQFKVVCGAPNVKAGMIAPLALVGAQLGKEPPLEAAVIRGVQSEGMLCSERELGLSQDHAGILALGTDAPLGGEVAAYLHLDDIVLDVEITPNRGDCLSILGLAREVAALFGGRLRAPRLRAAHSAGSSDSAQFSISVAIDAPDLCPRYAALAMTGIKIGPSPAWLKRRLELCGMRALNNVVDATNYVMLELGQPLHAFDYAKNRRRQDRRAPRRRDARVRHARQRDPRARSERSADRRQQQAARDCGRDGRSQLRGQRFDHYYSARERVLRADDYRAHGAASRIAQRGQLSLRARHRSRRSGRRADSSRRTDPQNRARARGLANRRLRAAQSRAARDRARPRRDGIAARRSRSRRASRGAVSNRSARK